MNHILHPKGKRKELFPSATLLAREALCSIREESALALVIKNSSRRVLQSFLPAICVFLPHIHSGLGFCFIRHLHLTRTNNGLALLYGPILSLLACEPAIGIIPHSIPLSLSDIPRRHSVDRTPTIETAEAGVQKDGSDRCQH